MLKTKETTGISIFYFADHTGKCLYLAGLVPEPMTADDDSKLVHFGIGFTNMVSRATKGSADLTRKEIREGNECRPVFIEPFLIDF